MAHSPLRPSRLARSTPAPDAPRFESSQALVESLRPSRPILCVRPHVIAEAARRFCAVFPGRVLYALKCNPNPLVMSALWAGGIRGFDVASLVEIEQVRAAFPEALAAFMHPVKSREAIRAAYHSHGLRHFVVDHSDELEKLFAETGGRHLHVFVRIKTPEASQVLYHLAAKFGAEPNDAAAIVREAAARGCRTGLTFHVGSQCLEPAAYRRAIELVAEVVAQSGELPACIDVGGGFPERYPGVESPPLEEYVAEIVAALRDVELYERTELWAEPGRALVAGGCSLVARIELRKDDQLYLNDGVYGAFSELIDSEQELPARALSPGAGRCGQARDFVVHGPTCDSMDTLTPTLRLPADVSEGDWLEIDQIGAYSNALSTRFNGFELDAFAEVADAPLSRAGEPAPAAEDATVDSS